MDEALYIFTFPFYIQPCLLFDILNHSYISLHFSFLYVAKYTRLETWSRFSGVATPGLAMIVAQSWQPRWTISSSVTSTSRRAITSHGPRTILVYVRSTMDNIMDWKRKLSMVHAPWSGAGGVTPWARDMTSTSTSLVPRPSTPRGGWKLVISDMRSPN